MNYSDPISYLESFINYEHHLDKTAPADFRPERMVRLLQALDSPQEHARVVHVAGSKGKGSVCAMTAQILKEAGYSVGLYTSPHILDIRERIRVLSGRYLPSAGSDIFPDMITERELAEAVETVRPAADALNETKRYGQLTFFEVFTAVAFVHFRAKKVDFIVLETGLGGRLDATNAAPSVVVAVTPISLEHTHLLGDSVEKIAREKAAIIKDRHQSVVLAPQADSVADVLNEQCRQFGIEPCWVKKDLEARVHREELHGQEFDLTTEQAHYEQIILPLLGAHQRINCAVAVSITEALDDRGIGVPHLAVLRGIEGTFWPLRYEVFSIAPVVILDGAHNAPSMAETVTLTKRLFGNCRIQVVFGCSQNKDDCSMMDVLKGLTDEILFVKSQHPRAMDLPQAADVKSTMMKLMDQNDPERVILVTGSLYAASEARRCLSERQACIS